MKLSLRPLSLEGWWSTQQRRVFWLSWPIAYRLSLIARVSMMTRWFAISP